MEFYKNLKISFEIGELTFLYARRRRDVLCYHLRQVGGVPHSLSEHISKNMLATVMKLHGWIDLIKAECSA